MKALKSLVFFSPFGFAFSFFTYIVRNVNYKLCDDCNPAETLVGTLAVNCALEPSCRVVVVDVFARACSICTRWRCYCSLAILFGLWTGFFIWSRSAGLQSTFEEVAKRFDAVRSKWHGGTVGDNVRLAAFQEAQMAQSPGKGPCGIAICCAVRQSCPRTADGRQQRQDEECHPLLCFVDSISGFMDERILHTLGLIVQDAGADDKTVETRRNRTRSSGVGSR